MIKCEDVKQNRCNARKHAKQQHCIKQSLQEACSKPAGGAFRKTSQSKGTRGDRRQKTDGVYNNSGKQSKVTSSTQVNVCKCVSPLDCSR